MIYILGASAMARETLSLYNGLGRIKDIGGFIEENCKTAGSKIHGKNLMDASIIDTLPEDSIFIGAMGSPKRRRWIEEIERRGFNFDTLIHPSVTMGDFVDVGTGSIVCPGVILTCEIEIGRHSIINIASTVNHNCVVGNFVTIGPSVSIAGNVTISDGCWISIGAKIIHRISIGRGSFIGAGAVVTKDIPGNVLAVGSPAKPIREMTESDWKQLI